MRLLGKETGPSFATNEAEAPFLIFFFITNISIEICFMVYRFIKVKRIDELSLKHFKAIFDRKRGWKSESSPFFSL